MDTMGKPAHIRSMLGALLVLFATSASAYDGPVEKKVFTLPTYTTTGGKTIRNVRVGYETYGTLNAAGDNAIFIPHFFSGTSHAAGKYKAARRPDTGIRSSARESRSIPTSISS